MQIPQPRDYQFDLINGVQAQFALGLRRVLMVAPTGAGKGTIASYIVAKSVAKGKRVIFLVNRRTLVWDMCKRLRNLGIEHGIVMGASTRGTHLPVQVASIDTLRNRELPPADLAFMDEAHFAVSDGWASVMSRYIDSGAYIILMTATPIRLDGRGLGAIADSMVEGPTVASLMARGFLVRVRNFAPSIPDLSEVHSVGGDYNTAELAKAMSKPKLIGDSVEHWQRLAKDRPTVVFCVNKAHGEYVSQQFNAAGHIFPFADCNTKDKDREQLWRELERGNINGVVSVGIVSYGWDVPPVSCCINLRATQSLALALQQWGRILRPVYASGFADTDEGRLAAIAASSKPNGIILDHSGNIMRHGFVDDERSWSLDDKKRRKGKSAALPAENLPKVCPECAAVWPAGTIQCACGYAFASGRQSGPVVKDGDLIEVDKHTYRLEDYQAHAGTVPADDHAVQSIIKQAHQRGYKPAAVGFKVRALEEARAKYKRETGKEAKPYWSSAAITNMLEI